jgi:succinoglycan biosynthesis transport protein ExoP
LEQRYDLVVIDSPPVLAGVDTWLLAHRASTTVLLTRWRHTSMKQAALAIKMLAVSQAKLAGVVLSMVNVTQNMRYDHGDAVLFSSTMRRYYNETLALPHQPGGGTFP